MDVRHAVSAAGVAGALWGLLGEYVGLALAQAEGAWDEPGIGFKASVFALFSVIWGLGVTSALAFPRWGRVAAPGMALSGLVGGDLAIFPAPSVLVGTLLLLGAGVAPLSLGRLPRPEALEQNREG